MVFFMRDNLYIEELSGDEDIRIPRATFNRMFGSSRGSVPEVIDLVSDDESPPIINHIVPSANMYSPHSTVTVEVPNINSTNSKKRSLEQQNIVGSSKKHKSLAIKVKLEFPPKSFGESNIDDEVIEVECPYSENEIVTTNDDVVFVGGNMQVATELPHPRDICMKFKFSVHGGKDNLTFCAFCYCYVCEVKASQCQYWTDHCDASCKNPNSKALRNIVKSKIFSLLNQENKLIFKTIILKSNSSSHRSHDGMRYPRYRDYDDENDSYYESEEESNTYDSYDDHVHGSSIQSYTLKLLENISSEYSKIQEKLALENLPKYREWLLQLLCCYENTEEYMYGNSNFSIEAKVYSYQFALICDVDQEFYDTYDEFIESRMMNSFHESNKEAFFKLVLFILKFNLFTKQGKLNCIKDFSFTSTSTQENPDETRIKSNIRNLAAISFNVDNRELFDRCTKSEEWLTNNDAFEMVHHLCVLKSSRIFDFCQYLESNNIWVNAVSEITLSSSYKPPQLYIIIILLVNMKSFKLLNIARLLLNKSLIFAISMGDFSNTEMIDASVELYKHYLPYVESLPSTWSRITASSSEVNNSQFKSLGVTENLYQMSKETMYALLIALLMSPKTTSVFTSSPSPLKKFPVSVLQKLFPELQKQKSPHILAIVENYLSNNMVALIQNNSALHTFLGEMSVLPNKVSLLTLDVKDTSYRNTHWDNENQRNAVTTRIETKLGMHLSNDSCYSLLRGQFDSQQTIMIVMIVFKSILCNLLKCSYGKLGESELKLINMCSEKIKSKLLEAHGNGHIDYFTSGESDYYQNLQAINCKLEEKLIIAFFIAFDVRLFQYHGSGPLEYDKLLSVLISLRKCYEYLYSHQTKDSNSNDTQLMPFEVAWKFVQQFTREWIPENYHHHIESINTKTSLMKILFLCEAWKELGITFTYASMASPTPILQIMKELKVSDLHVKSNIDNVVEMLLKGCNGFNNCQTLIKELQDYLNSKESRVLISRLKISKDDDVVVDNKTPLLIEMLKSTSPLTCELIIKIDSIAAIIAYYKLHSSNNVLLESFKTKVNEKLLNYAKQFEEMTDMHEVKVVVLDDMMNYIKLLRILKRFSTLNTFIRKSFSCSRNILHRLSKLYDFNPKHKVKVIRLQDDNVNRREEKERYSTSFDINLFHRSLDWSDLPESGCWKLDSSHMCDLLDFGVEVYENDEDHLLFLKCFRTLLIDSTFQDDDNLYTCIDKYYNKFSCPTQQKCRSLFDFLCSPSPYYLSLVKDSSLTFISSEALAYLVLLLFLTHRVKNQRDLFAIMFSCLSMKSINEVVNFSLFFDWNVEYCINSMDQKDPLVALANTNYLHVQDVFNFFENRKGDVSDVPKVAEDSSIHKIEDITGLVETVAKLIILSKASLPSQSLYRIWTILLELASNASNFRHVSGLLPDVKLLDISSNDLVGVMNVNVDVSASASASDASKLPLLLKKYPKLASYLPSTLTLPEMDLNVFVEHQVKVSILSSSTWTSSNIFMSLLSLLGASVVDNMSIEQCNIPSCLIDVIFVKLISSSFSSPEGLANPTNGMNQSNTSLQDCTEKKLSLICELILSRNPSLFLSFVLHNTKLFTSCTRVVKILLKTIPLLFTTLLRHLQQQGENISRSSSNTNLQSNKLLSLWHCCFLIFHVLFALSNRIDLNEEDYANIKAEIIASIKTSMTSEANNFHILKVEQILMLGFSFTCDGFLTFFNDKSWTEAILSYFNDGKTISRFRDLLWMPLIVGLIPPGLSLKNFQQVLSMVLNLLKHSDVMEMMQDTSLTLTDLLKQSHVFQDNGQSLEYGLSHIRFNANIQDSSKEVQELAIKQFLCDRKLIINSLLFPILLDKASLATTQFCFDYLSSQLDCDAHLSQIPIFEESLIPLIHWFHVSKSSSSSSSSMTSMTSSSDSKSTNQDFSFWFELKNLHERKSFPSVLLLQRFLNIAIKYKLMKCFISLLVKIASNATEFLSQMKCETTIEYLIIISNSCDSKKISKAMKNQLLELIHCHTSKYNIETLIDNFFIVEKTHPQTIKKLFLESSFVNPIFDSYVSLITISYSGIRKTLCLKFFQYMKLHELEIFIKRLTITMIDYGNHLRNNTVNRNRKFLFEQVMLDMKELLGSHSQELKDITRQLRGMLRKKKALTTILDNI